GLTSAARREDGASERHETSGRGGTEGASGRGAASSGLTSAARREDGASERHETSGRGGTEGASGRGAASSGLTSAARREDGASERHETSGRGGMDKIVEAGARLRDAALGTALVFAVSGAQLGTWVSRLPAVRDRVHA